MDQCENYLDRDNIYITIINIFFISCIILSYLPQYIKIFKSKSVTGISELSIICGVLSSYTNLIGIILLSLDIVNCCKTEYTLTQCSSTLAPVFQIGTSFLSLFVLFCMFIKYSENRKKIILYLSTLISIFGITILMYYNTYINSVIHEKNILLGYVFNALSSSFTIIMWLPQIYIIHTKKEYKNLSLIMISIQSLGSLVFFIFQYVIFNEPLVVGLPYLISSVQQLYIILAVSYYNRITKKDRNMIDIYTELTPYSNSS